MIRTGGVIRTAAARRGFADLRGSTEVAAAATVEIARIWIDAAELAAHDAAVVLTRSAIGETCAAFDVLDARTLGEKTIVSQGAGTCVEIERGVLRTGRNAASSALIDAIRAGADATAGVDAGRTGRATL